MLIATLDPNPLVAGKGVAMLEKAGITVKIGLLEVEAQQLNRAFIKRMKTGLPFVTCKIAMSLDGKTSMKSGESKWITGEAARLDVQKLRATHQVIMTGSGTILSDNPSMTVRLDGVNNAPLRIVIDGKNQITNSALNIFSNDAQTRVFNSNNSQTKPDGRLDLTHILKQLEVNSVLLEAGPALIGAMLKANLIDEFIIYTAPILMGSDANSMIKLPYKNMSDKVELTINDIRMIGDDIKLTAALK
ncbi:Diaminohydroxyphosphoribosylaminopyrimidine deaminase / 5-amino-6-(5-phosphoribosylamino)uracil reductase [uncultured Candidatus Thioglobus sp.]|nr:Diaminohydroxyphosphoribosylaminopyrimidine deaminase / 5-amino-6-(5-phosphoribosylamino)uracil reductase [uncultured Candidatus Thioglobus sp.]